MNSCDSTFGSRLLNNVSDIITYSFPKRWIGHPICTPICCSHSHLKPYIGLTEPRNSWSHPRVRVRRARASKLIKKAISIHAVGNSLVEGSQLCVPLVNGWILPHSLWTVLWKCSKIPKIRNASGLGRRSSNRVLIFMVKVKRQERESKASQPVTTF